MRVLSFYATNNRIQSDIFEMSLFLCLPYKRKFRKKARMFLLSIFISILIKTSTDLSNLIKMFSKLIIIQKYSICSLINLGLGKPFYADSLLNNKSANNKQVFFFIYFYVFSSEMKRKSLHIVPYIINFI